MIDPTITFEDQPPSLASTGKDFTGAYAVLNIGHWLTWTRPIIEHEAGSDNFHYCTNNFFARIRDLITWNINFLRITSLGWLH